MAGCSNSRASPPVPVSVMRCEPDSNNCFQKIVSDISGSSHQAAVCSGVYFSSSRHEMGNEPPDFEVFMFQGKPTAKSGNSPEKTQTKSTRERGEREIEREKKKKPLLAKMHQTPFTYHFLSMHWCIM